MVAGFEGFNVRPSVHNGVMAKKKRWIVSRQARRSARHEGVSISELLELFSDDEAAEQVDDPDALA